MDISIPVFIAIIIIGLICLWIGFSKKGNKKVFGQNINSKRLLEARFWLTAGWVIIVLSVLYFIFIILAHLYLKLY